MEMIITAVKQKDIEQLEREFANSGELIRCRNCIYWKSEEERAKQTAWLPCMEVATDRNWFCASGER